MSALKAIQTAIYALLSADATLLSLATVHNDVPEGQAFPHVEIGSATERPWHAFGGPTLGLGWNTTVTIHIWSRYQGDVEALTILDRVTALLNFATLSVSGFSSVLAELDNTRVLVQDVDKVETRHVAAMFRFRVQQ
jgi:hypothetical protein